MNVLIVDDDIDFIQKLKIDIEEFFKEDIIITIKDNDFQSYPYVDIDVVFLDIDLKTCSGIDVGVMLKQRYPNIVLIFCSSREDLVFQSLTTGLFQFIRKSKYEEDKIIVLHQLKQYIEQTNTKKQIRIKGRNVVIDTNDIQYIISLGHEVVIHLSKEEYVVKSTMQNILNKLECNNLIQIERNLIVHFQYIQEATKTNVILKDHKEYIIGRKYKKDFLSRYEEYLMR